MNPTAVDDVYADATVCPQCGRESCEEHVPPEPTAPPAFVPASDVITRPAPMEIIEGVLLAGKITALVSESGAGKTFLLLSASAAVSSGVDWMGRAVQQGSVAYASFEGDALGVRLRAIAQHQGHRLEHVYALQVHDPLSPRLTRDGEVRSTGELAVASALKKLAADVLAAHRPPIRVIVIDTVRASLSGSEDSSEHVSAYLRAVRRLSGLVPDAGIILAHHAGWQDGEQQRKRERGSSAWRGNVDATIYLEVGHVDPDRGEASLIIRTLKLRDFERPAPLHVIRRRVELPESNGRGEPVTSCIIERDTRTPQERTEAAQAAEAVTHETLDVVVLRAMQDSPNATSIAKLQPYVGKKTSEVTAAVGRLLRANYAVAGARNKPFTVTQAGQAWLDHKSQ